MHPEFEHLSEDDRLKAENEFLKMKMMLEQGAFFGGIDNQMALPPQIENQFLRNIMAFETQIANPTYIKVFDKIGRPTHFKPVADILAWEMEKEWETLLEYLDGYGIHLSACSPNITSEELYRFTIEELFEHEMEDIRIPGYTTEFIYDEFHPDPVYENTRLAVQDCIGLLLEKAPLKWTYYFKENQLRLNQHYPLTMEELKKLVGLYKEAYETIEINDLFDQNCEITDNHCVVTGNYSLEVGTQSEKYSFSGNWIVHFEKEEESGDWLIAAIEIEGINF
jgi:hypothetical protein